MKVETRPMTAGRPKFLSFTITFENSDLHLQETPFGLVVELAGCIRSGIPGGPALPVKLVQIALPPFTRPDAVTFKSVRSRRITRQHVPVAPQQPPPPPWPTPWPGANGHGDTPPYRPPQPELYEAEIAAPRPLAQFVGARHFGFTPVVAVRLNPIRYRKDGTLEFHSVIEVTILVENASDLAGVAGGPGGPRTVDPKRFLAETLRTAGAIRSPAEHHRLTGLAESVVINPGDVAAFDHPHPEPGEGAAAKVWHLIITDDCTWDAQTITPDSKPNYAPQGLVAAFQRLANWRGQLGTQSRVVTITDIVNYEDGKFKNGARDLQEVIRNFLKWAHREWRVQFVLLGGDVGIVPVRLLADNYKDLLRKCWVSPSAAPNGLPEPGESYWVDGNGAHLRMNLNIDVLAWFGWNWLNQPYPDLLLQPDTGTIIEHDQSSAAWGTGKTFWCWTTDNSYATAAPATSADPRQVRTGYVRVEGPPDLVNRDMQWLYHDNLLPSDFYYASLGLPDGEPAPTHDWDVMSKGQDWGIYGLRDAQGHDGIRYEADVSVGRAPVRSAAEATAFVEKVMAYEKGDAFDWQWPTHSLYVSANWEDNVVGVADASMTQTEDLRKQMDRDFPGIRARDRLYEDWDDLGQGQQDGPGQVFGPEDQKQNLMQAAVRSNPHLLVIASHAWPGGIAYLDTSWVQSLSGSALSNGMPGFIVYANGCASNEFDIDATHLVEPVGKCLLRQSGGGAVAYIGCTRMSVGVADVIERSILHSLAAAPFLLGNALDARCLVSFTPEQTVSADPHVAYWAMAVKWMTLGLHLLGDPLMRVWPDEVWPLDDGPHLDFDLEGGHVTYTEGGDQSSFDMHLTVCTDYDPSTGDYGTVIDGSSSDGQGGWPPHPGPIGRPDAPGASPRRCTVTLPPGTAGDLLITVSAPGRAPLIRVRHLARPGWVSGRVTGVAHGGEGGREARVTLRLEKPRGRKTDRTWLICADERDYDVLVNAALSAYATRDTIALYVDDVSAESPVHGFRLAETR